MSTGGEEDKWRVPGSGEGERSVYFHLRFPVPHDAQCPGPQRQSSLFWTQNRPGCDGESVGADDLIKAWSQLCTGSRVGGCGDPIQCSQVPQTSDMEQIRQARPQHFCKQAGISYSASLGMPLQPTKKGAEAMWKYLLSSFLK